MPSVDDVLRQAFEARDDGWQPGAETARRTVRARHHRRQVATRAAAASACAAALVVAAAALTSGPDPRTVAPVVPPPASSTSPAPGTPLEGTWTSTDLNETDVTAAANAAGVPGAVDAMLEQLPAPPFQVVMVVRGSSLTTSVRAQGAQGALMDQETLSTTGQRLEVRPFDVPVATIHRWVLESAVLTMSFESTTEVVKDGVPGEAWQRLLYDSAPFTR